ncbi:alpha-methylacyl-CoA racemase [Geomicrobium sp. JCM 19037]|uniref:CaiB/BaiF CoA transferase family protein n=1 Tax=Geomicrobium sp. JCM 19037 TaxID=1460634 RepID=UPI00045F1F9A|nr:CoA transferase [Geomicrobium sp. JCM 19037]GAK04465.1 alpha-methylacyl-CoA racemase [Geomicrobium sp. JCM 19037]
MALNDLRVLDLSRLLPGPYCSMMFADFGADVIKIESIDGDPARLDPLISDEKQAMFHSLNRNKRSLCLDLKSPEGSNHFLKLVKEADVVIESFRPGVMDRLGIGYETLKSENKRLVYCAITGYGQSGPDRTKAGHNVNFISRAGILDLSGHAGEKPVIPPAQIGDIGGGGLLAFSGIMIALHERDRTGVGQFVDISMLDGALSWMQTSLPQFLSSGAQESRGELPLSGSLACYETYETKDNRWFAVGALEPKFWRLFCEQIDRPDLISRQTGDAAVQREVKREVQREFHKRSFQEWSAIFANSDACVTPVATFAEMTKDPQVVHREMIQDDAPSGRTIAQPIRLSETPARVRTGAPALGEHTEQIIQHGWVHRNASVKE